jgi:RHS repeat-associated protein
LNTTSQLYDIEFRNYDPALARMHQVDQMSDKYSSLSAYHYSFNNPVSHNDPNGADPNPGEPDHVTRRGVQRFDEYFYGSGDMNWLYQDITPGSGGNWADGSQYADWSPNDGSAIYQNGIAKGYSDFGGQLYNYEGGGVWGHLESNGDYSSKGVTSSVTINLDDLPRNSQTTLFMRDGKVTSYFQTTIFRLPPSNNTPVAILAFNSSNWIPDDPTHEHGPINLAGAIAWLNDTAMNPPPYGNKKCAKYVTLALEIGGGAVRDVYAENGYAKNFGPMLIDMGFKALDVKSLTDYTPMAGDVAVLQPWTNHADIYGHMEMYSGTQWVSDYFQGQNFYPWKGSIGATDLPSFTVYRYTPPNP